MRALIAILAALAAALAAVPEAFAQDVPQVISPLRVENDPNGVNLLSGKMRIEGPSLSVPAAPNLRFDRPKNAAPYVLGKISGAPGDSVQGSYTVHTGQGTDAFKCVDDVCKSVTGTGSSFQANVGVNGNVYFFTEAGSGAVWKFDRRHLRTTAENPNTIQYYASSVTYPNREAISYDYGIATLASDPSRTWYRPTRLTSSLGYRIVIVYRYDGTDVGNPDWDRLSVVTLSRTGTDQPPLARLTYGDGAITDLGGRAYSCSGCTDVEAISGWLTLPGETAPAVQAERHPTVPVVASVVRDGVAWTYSYLNPRLGNGGTGYVYDRLTVEGLLGFRNIYVMSGSNIRNVITRSTDSNGRHTDYVFDEAYRPTRMTAPEGNRIDVGYDQFGNIVSRTATPKAGAGAVTETALFPSDDSTLCNGYLNKPRCYRPLWSKDALGRRTDYAWNDLGQLVEQTDPADQNGRRKKTYIAYEEGTALSRKSVVRMCLAGSTCGTNLEIRTEYQYWGNTLLPSRERRIEGYYGRIRDTHFSYDDAGRPLSTDGPLPGADDAVYSRYDVHGRKTWEIGARSPEGLRIATRFVYRASDDKPLYSETGTLTDPASEVLSVFSRSDFAYDRRNPVRVAVSASGAVRRVTDQSWDARGRLVCTAVRMNTGSFGQQPGACFQTPGVAVPDRITRNHYDPAGQLIRVEKAVGTPLRQDYAKYEYWPNGTRAAVIDANGNRAEMSYDGFDRLQRWTFPSNTPGLANAADYEEYGYDLAGNRTRLRKRDGSELGYVYDDLNRVIRKIVPERPGLAAAQTRDVFYAYDHALGLQTHARFDSLDGEGVASWYDGFGQRTTTLSTMGGQARYVTYYHDDAGNLHSLGHPDGAAFVSNHDALGRVSATWEHRAPSSIDDYVVRYWYNAAGSRQAAVRGAGSGGFTTVWYRDPLERPTTIANDLPGTVNDAPIELAYNEASQIVGRTVHNDAYASLAAANAARGYRVNGLNQYTGTTWGGAPNWSFDYDPNGNLTRSADPVGTDTVNYLYDVENRLVSASGASSAALVYDPLGRLFQVTAGNGAVTRFLHDGDRIIAEYDGSGALTRRYVHGPGADDPVAVYEGPALGLATRRYTLPDERGSVAALIDADASFRI